MCLQMGARAVTRPFARGRALLPLANVVTGIRREAPGPHKEGDHS
jgi:hypothetical protein